MHLYEYLYKVVEGHGGAVVIHSPPTSEVGSSNPGPYVDKLVVAYHGQKFTVQNLDQLYVLVSSAQKLTYRNISSTVLKVSQNP